MKVLIVHHLQPMWDAGLHRFGTSFEEMKERLLIHLDENTYDKVIFPMFEHYERMDYHEGIWGINATFVNYDYGWCPEDYEEAEENEDGYELFEDQYIPVSGSSYCERWALVNSEVREWMPKPEDDVSICGAFDGECLADLESVLDYCNIPYTRLNELIR
jgi:hypothetical protein